jgi:hypothetical protein
MTWFDTQYGGQMQNWFMRNLWQNQVQSTIGDMGDLSSMSQLNQLYAQDALMRSGIPSGLSPFGFAGGSGPGQIGGIPSPNVAFSGLPAGRGITAADGPPPTVTSANGTQLTASGNTAWSVKTNDGYTVECSGDPHWKVTGPDGKVTYFDTSKNTDLTLGNGDKIIPTVSNGDGQDKGYSVTRGITYVSGGNATRIQGVDGGNPHFVDANGNTVDAAHAVSNDGYQIRAAVDAQHTDDNLELANGGVYKFDSYGNEQGRITGRGSMGADGMYTQQIDTNDQIDPNSQQPSQFIQGPNGRWQQNPDYGNWVRGKMVDDFSNSPYTTPDQAVAFGQFMKADDTNSRLNSWYRRDERQLGRLLNNPPPYFGGLNSYYGNWGSACQPSSDMWSMVQQAIQQQQALQYGRYAGIYN